MAHRKLVRRVVAKVDIPEELYNPNFLVGGYGVAKWTVEAMEETVNHMREVSINTSAAVELFKVKIESAIEVAKDMGALNVEVIAEGHYNNRCLSVAGDFEPTAKELNKMNGMAKALLTKHAKGLTKHQVNAWSRDVLNSIKSAFANADLEMSGLNQTDEYIRLMGVLKETFDKQVDDLLSKASKVTQ